MEDKQYFCLKRRNSKFGQGKHRVFEAKERLVWSDSASVDWKERRPVSVTDSKNLIVLPEQNFPTWGIRTPRGMWK